MKERIALVTVYYSPQHGVAVNRMNAFARYLSETYEVEVFTLGNGGVQDQDGIKVHYIPTPTFFDAIQHKESDSKFLHHLKTLINLTLIFLRISIYRSWSKKCVDALKRSHKLKGFDVILSSYAPVEAHEVAYTIKKMDPSVFWIADMRDEMSKNPFASNRVQKRLRQKELLFQEHIDALTTVSEPILEDFKKLMPKVGAFEVVRNGFDHNFEPTQHRNEEFTLVYAGTFYGSNKPDRFLEMVDKLIQTKQIDRIRINFLGTSRNFVVPKSLEPYVHFLPKVSYPEAIREMDRADCNLLMCPPFETKGRYTGKLFDYISVQKPILALIDTEDVASDLILELDAGEVGDFFDMETAQRNVLKLYHDWQAHKRASIDAEKVKMLHRRVQIDKIKRLIASRKQHEEVVREHAVEKGKKIALISVWFPPTKGVAVNRMEAFANFLGSDHDVTVITLGDSDTSEYRSFGRVFYISSNVVWRKIKHKQTDGKLLHRIKSLFNLVAYRIGLSPYRSWEKRALKLAENLHLEGSFDIVISSYAPIEAHDVAYKLKLKYPQIEWFADMRDEMSGNPFEQDSIKRKLRKKELLYSKHITLLTSVAEPILEEFKVLMPDVPNFIEVRNGYNHNVLPKQNFNRKFTIVYAGTFYGKRKPDSFFQGIMNLLDKGEIDTDICFKFIGTNRNFNIPSQVLPFVEFVPQLSYLEAIELMAEADCNLLINPPLGTKGQYSGKIFDYVSVQKPILAYVDLNDVAAELINDYKAGIAVEFDDVEAGERAIQTIYRGWKERIPYAVDRDRTHELHRKYQVQKINTFITSLTK